MDRFIGVNNDTKKFFIRGLKSNMDRFIGSFLKIFEQSFFEFKIQYG